MGWLMFFSKPDVQYTFYAGMVVFLVVFLSIYTYYLYSREKSGHKDFEKYHDLVTKDDIFDMLIEDASKHKK